MSDNPIVLFAPDHLYAFEMGDTSEYARHFTQTVEWMTRALAIMGWVVDTSSISNINRWKLVDGVLLDPSHPQRPLRQQVEVHLGDELRNTAPDQWRENIPRTMSALEPTIALAAIMEHIVSHNAVPADSIITPGLLYDGSGVGRFTDVTRWDIFPPRLGREKGHIVLDWNWNNASRARALHGIGYGRFL